MRDLVPFVQFKKREKNTHRGVLFLVFFTKSNTPQWMLFPFFKLYK